MFLSIKRTCRPPDLQSGCRIILLACVCTFFGCIARNEGCLDIAAENFDLSADKSCAGCCTYPSISLSLSQKWGTRNFHTDSLYHDFKNMPFYIRDLDYFMSSFAWEDTDLTSYTIDSTEIQCGADVIRYTPDIVQVDARRFVYLLDSIRVFPFIEALNFKVGVVPELNCVDETDDDTPLVLSDASPLWDTLANARSAIRVVLQTDTSVLSLDTVYIHTCLPVSLPYFEEFEPGRDKVLNLTVDYSLWFSTFDKMNLNSLTPSLITGIPVSFSRTP